MYVLRSCSLAAVTLFLWTLCACQEAPVSAHAPEGPPANLLEAFNASQAPDEGDTSHFTVHATRTGNNATIILPADAAALLQVGDEVGVFTPAGLCVGTLRWQGTNAALSVWGDDEMTPEVEGLRTDEPLAFRIWDSKRRTEYGRGNAEVLVRFSDAQPYLQTKLRYYPNAIYVVAALSVKPGPASN